MNNEKKKSLLSRIISEYKKVVWASSAEVFQVTVIVLLISAFVAVMVLGFDFTFKMFIEGLSNIIARIFK